MSALVQLMLVAGVVALGVAVASLVPRFTSDRPYETNDEDANEETSDDHTK